VRNRLLFAGSTIGVNLLIAQIGASIGMAYAAVLLLIIVWTTVNTLYFGRIMSALGLWKAA
jgi:hypothetical protein